ncbi:MAG: hypothetical protein ACNA77_10560 [Opitutales bacterium]
MRKEPALLFATLLLLLIAPLRASAEEIILRLRPEADAPVLNRITATEKVLLEAAPAGDKDAWRELELKLPFEGYVPAASLSNLDISAPTHRPEAKALAFNPERAIGKTAPEDLPPENVTWQSAPARSAAATEPETEILGRTRTPDRPDSATPPYFEESGIIVSPEQTQAREANLDEAPPADQATRLLVGRLVRKIDSAAPDYPIRLHADEGRLIAYVDFSGYFIEDLSPYLNQRVHLGGRLAAVRANSRKLVLYVDDIQIAP